MIALAAAHHHVSATSGMILLGLAVALTLLWLMRDKA